MKQLLSRGLYYACVSVWKCRYSVTLPSVLIYKWRQNVEMGWYQVTSRYSVISKYRYLQWLSIPATDYSRKQSTSCRTLRQRLAVLRCDTMADHNLCHVPFKQARRVADPNMTDSIMSPVWDINTNNQTIAECKLYKTKGERCDMKTSSFSSNLLKHIRVKHKMHWEILYIHQSTSGMDIWVLVLNLILLTKRRR